MSLAIESGATSSTVLYLPKNEADSITLTLGPGNFRLMSPQQLEDFFQEIKIGLKGSPVTSLGIGMPGILTDRDKSVVATAVKKAWSDVENFWIGSDTDTALASINSSGIVKVVVIGGTGSNCVGFDGTRRVKVGGYGHVLGDRGSGYAIAHKALRVALRELEQTIEPAESTVPNPWNVKTISENLLIMPIMKFLGFEDIDHLVAWSTQATKTEIAGVAFTVLEAWKKGNLLAKKVVDDSLRELAEDCSCVIKKLISNGEGKQDTVTIGLTGSLFTKNEDFAKEFTETVKTQVGKEASIEVEILYETVSGALKMMGIPNNNNNYLAVDPVMMQETEEDLAQKILPVYLGLPQTECRNPKSMTLDVMGTDEAISLMISEEIGIYDQILKEKDSIAILIEKVADAFRNGGRLFYIGAGTSGRLGILDASECPPTFRSNPEMVQGIIAGGFSSVSKAKEGAEDSIIDGMNAVSDKNVTSKDVVIGIAASGRTPFVWGGMYQAKLLGAFTAFLTFNVRLSMKQRPDLVLAMDLGPEVLTGSTRLKSGSATKCILNMLSTLAMVKIGKCFENLMVDLNPANQKLKQRALRIVLLMTNHIPHLTEKQAQEVLIKNKYDIKSTVVELRSHLLVPEK